LLLEPPLRSHPVIGCSGKALFAEPFGHRSASWGGGIRAGGIRDGDRVSLATREVIVRKVLFGTTALVGAVMLAGAASAQTAGPKAPFTAILDGEVNANFGILSGTQNSGANGGHQRDFGEESNAWMRFFFEGKADNGLTYGWYVRILGTSSSIAQDGFSNDRESMYFRHPAWGTVEIGNGTASGKQGFPFVTADWGPPTSSQSYLGPDGKLEGEFLRNTDTRAYNLFNSFIKVGSDNGFPSGRAEHIWYGTPQWNGFSLNMDYTPDGATRNEENFVTSTQSGTPSATQSLSEGNFQNVASLNVQYKGTVGPVAVAGGFQYAHGQSKNLFTTTGSTQAFHDINSYEFGGAANYAGFQFSLEATEYGDSGRPKNAVGNINDTWGWSTGLEYFTGPWVIGGYYWFERGAGSYQLAGAAPIVTAGGITTTPSNGAVEMNNYAVGVGYTVAPGLKLYTEAFFYDYYNTHILPTAGQLGANNGRRMNGQVYIFGTTFAW
jgi:hypothetical protein